MYFLEFLETCTIGWVSFCECGVGMERERRKTPFLNFFYARCRPPDPRLSPYTPEVETTAPSAPGRTAQHRQQRRPCKARRTGIHARTLDTLHRSALDTRRTAPGKSGRWRGWTACVVCPTGHAQTDKIIVNKNIYFLCVNPLTKEIKLFTI